jgi:hypothetical protein
MRSIEAAIDQYTKSAPDGTQEKLIFKCRLFRIHNSVTIDGSTGPGYITPSLQMVEHEPG